MDKRIENLLSRPDKLREDSHLTLPKPLKWEAALAAAAIGCDLSEYLRLAVSEQNKRFRKKQKAAFDAQQKRWGPYEAPTYGRKGRV